MSEKEQSIKLTFALCERNTSLQMLNKVLKILNIKHKKDKDVKLLKHLKHISEKDLIKISEYLGGEHEKNIARYNLRKKYEEWIYVEVWGYRVIKCRRNGCDHHIIAEVDKRNIPYVTQCPNHDYYKKKLKF